MTIPSTMTHQFPYWWENAPLQTLTETPVDHNVDVVIVGAGYAGLTASISLARSGRSVAVFDALRPGEGASSRNGGITSGNIRPTHDAIVKRFGEQKALAIEAEGKEARDFLENLIRSENLDCDFQKTGLFVGAIGLKEYGSQARRAETLNKKLGIESYAVSYSQQQKYIGSNFYRGGLVRMDIGGLHPAKFHSELLRVAITAGVSIHSLTPVNSIKNLGERFEVTTARGSIQTDRVIVCTNGYTNEAVPFLNRRMVPVRSRMIATQILPTDLMRKLMPQGMMMGEAGLQMGCYYRPCPDRQRILLGGRDGTISGDSLAPVMALKNNLIQRFPELENIEISHTWFGNTAMHLDMLPRIFERDRILYATGFCGSGTVWATWLGYQAAQKLLSNNASQVSAFDFEPPAAVPLYRGKPWFIPMVIKGFQLQDVIAMRRARR